MYIPLSPVKSRHEGNVLHFSIPSGGATHPGSWTGSLPATISPARRSSRSARRARRPSAQADRTWRRWSARANGWKASASPAARQRARSRRGLKGRASDDAYHDASCEGAARGVRAGRFAVTWLAAPEIPGRRPFSASGFGSSSLGVSARPLGWQLGGS